MGDAQIPEVLALKIEVEPPNQHSVHRIIKITQQKLTLHAESVIRDEDRKYTAIRFIGPNILIAGLLLCNYITNV